MFKLISIAAMGYVMYKMIVDPLLNPADENVKIKHHSDSEKPKFNEGEYIEYEDIKPGEGSKKG